MDYKKQMKEWVDAGVITQEQANIMLVDVDTRNKDDRSNKFIATISSIGSVLFGLGAIMFIASNWAQMSDLLKVLILLVSTFGTYTLGYVFKYHKKNLPIVGSVLFLLGALLYGASIFLIAQIYNINANAHSLLLLWLIGILPLMYGFALESISALAAIIFYLWVGFYIAADAQSTIHSQSVIPVIIFSSSALLFSIGEMHYFIPTFQKIGQMFQRFALKFILFSLFLLTFEFFSGGISLNNAVTGDSSFVVTNITIFSIVAILGLVVSLFFNPTQSKTNLIESGSALGIIGLILLFLFFPANINIYTILFNLVFAGLTILLIYLGYKKQNVQMLNSGIFWISLFILARYFDFFWELLPRSLFFLVGGLILVLGGIAMEKKRRQIKGDFTKITPSSHG